MSAPAIEAWTNQRWKIRNPITIGTIVITDAAEITPQLVTNCPCSDATPTVSVFMLSVVVITSVTAGTPAYRRLPT